MLDTRTLAIAGLFALICLLLPGPAQASTKCQCNNGTIAISMDDGDDACDDACDEMGGGRVWQPSDSEDGDETVQTDGQVRRQERREEVGR